MQFYYYLFMLQQLQKFMMAKPALSWIVHSKFFKILLGDLIDTIQSQTTTKYK